MKKLIVKLKQHTPLIHFQNNKSGEMTIRATDVKPRLDKYLWKNGGNLDLSNYQLKKEHDALDYSMRIVPLQKMTSKIITGKKDRTWSPFFGNMGDEYEGNEKYLVYPGNFDEVALEVHVKSEHNDIIELIKKHISSFFLHTNFMTRSSKGFGSFTVVDGSELDHGKLKANYFTCRFQNNIESQSRLFAEIDWFYKAIRGGINIKDRNRETVFYFKSCLFKYLNAQGIQWDKKTIKSRFLASAQRKECAEYQDVIVCNPKANPKEQQTWKLFLGLASTESWHSEHTTLSATLKIGKEEFVRSPSFLTLKPIFLNGEYRVYIIEDYTMLDQYPENAVVNFEWKHENLSLKIGDVDIMKGFLPWIYNNLDGEHGTPQFYSKASILTRIFSELQRNYQNA